MSKILLVKTELGVPLNSTWSLYKGDILFCNESEDFPYILKELIYYFNEKQSKLSVNQNTPPWKIVTSLYDGNDLIPIEILLRDGLLEDITRDYKINKILEK